MVTGVELPKVGSLVYENSHVVVVDKPAGWLSVPSRIGAKDERFCLGRVLEQQLELRLWPVHRLDAEVSGLLMFAKSAAAHRLLGAGFEHHQIHKTYLAWSTGRLPQDAKLGVAQRWQCRLLRGKKRAYLHAAGVEGSVSITGPTTLSVHVTIVYQPKFLGTAGIGPKTVSGDATILLSRVVNGAPR